MKTTLVEKRTEIGAYDMDYNMIIIDTDKHGRILLTDGFGGMDSIDGGMYLWRHGLAIKLQPGDTLEKLENMDWNTETSYLDAVLHGIDNERPILNWPGYLIEKVAIKAIREN